MKIKNINKKKAIISIIIMIIILSLTTTLAFFVSSSSNTTETTNSLANIENTIDLQIDETNKKDNLVPIEEEYITKAAKQKCIDDLGNEACSIYKVTITNNAEVAQKINLNLKVEKNTFENYRLMIYKGRYITSPLSTPRIFTKDNLETLNLEETKVILLPGQSVIFNLVYYVNNIYDNTNDINQQFLGTLTASSEVTGDFTSDGKGEVETIKVDVATGLTPIKYSEETSRWVITSIDDADWYNYDEQKWANAAVLMNTASTTIGDPITVSSDEGTIDTYAMFVWIPRYSYTIGCTDTSSCYGYKVETDTTELSSTTPGAIDIKFVPSSTKEIYQNSETSGTAPTYTYLTTDTEEQRIAKRDEASNWYTHPAFTFGDKELSGLWVGKFETTGTESSPTILPNVTSLRELTISNQFTIAQKFTTNTSTYGLTGDAHMMKNSEWGAVSYLSQSIYGKYGNPNYTGANKEIYINNSSSYYTGRSGGGIGGATPINGTYTNQTSKTQYISYGFYTYDDYLLNYNTNTKGNKVEGKGTGASTTGNIYGIYDMSGGAWEYVMGNYNDGTKQVTGSSGFASTWFNEETNKKYFDKYTTTTPFTTKDNTTNGGALAETASWYSDYTDAFSTDYPWLIRGGYYRESSYAGPFFGYTSTDGSDSYYSCRVSFASTS